MSLEKLEKEVLTTKQAAELLDLSITSVQKMVINGELEAWTTPGGHRRIYRASVEALAKQRPGAGMAVSPAGLAAVASHSDPAATLALPSRSHQPQPGPGPQALRVLLAEDDADQVNYLRRLMQQSARAGVELMVASDASQALVLIERQRPDLVITDLVMQPFDGFHLVKMLDQDPAYRAIEVLVMTAMNPQEVQARGRLPAWVTVYQKPVGAERLLGYLDALQARSLRAHSSAPPGALP